MQISDIENILQNVSSNYNERNYEELYVILSQLKKEALRKNNEEDAKYIWCLETALSIQKNYIQAFIECKKDQYYKGWCDLERAEIQLGFINRHFPFEPDQFHLKFIYNVLEKIQPLFPYRIFLSPEIIENEKVCSICEEPILPRNPCPHKLGNIYQGEMCGRIVKKPQLVGMSFVRDPVQKYSVPFMSENGETKDHYDYSVIRYLIQRLDSPFHKWNVEMTTAIHPHTRFKHLSVNDKCPCASGIKYKKCCLKKEGVLMPHIQISFEVPPKIGTEIQYI